MQRNIVPFFLLSLILIFAGCLHQDTLSRAIESSTMRVLKVYVLDVGQGDSIFIITPNRHTILIDGGLEGNGKLILSYLKKEQVMKLDYIIATHPHPDHIGGLVEVINSIPVGRIYVNGETETSEENTNFMNAAKKYDILVMHRGDNITLDSVHFIALNPSDTPQKFNSNDNSIVIKITYGAENILLMGDCGIDCEQDILNAGFDVHAQILKVGHHGSKSTSSQVFLDAVRPKEVIISVGAGNEYGHPVQEILDRLRLCCRVYRTDIDGTITVEVTAVSYSITSEKSYILSLFYTIV